MIRCGMAAGVKLIIMSEFTQVIANPDFSISSKVYRDVHRTPMEKQSPILNLEIASLRLCLRSQ